MNLSFDIDAAILLPMSDGAALRTEPVPYRRKTYALDDYLYDRHDSETSLLVAEEDGDPAGYLSASRGWNACVVIDDIAVERPFRRRGLASTLIDQAVV